MPEEFEGDLAGAVFWGADLSGARFRDVDLTGVTISHAWLVDVDIDALVETVVINGVDVTDYVNDRDPWYPLRAMLRPADPAGMRAAWAALEAEWATTIARARALPESAVHESVDGEWSFVQTLRHLVFAMDKWFTAPILGAPFHPSGLPNSGSVDFPWPGLDSELTPSLADGARRVGGSSNAFRRPPRIAVGERSRTSGRRARERHQPGARVRPHGVRGGVLAQSLREAGPRPAGVGSIDGGNEMKLFFDDASFDGQLQRSVAKCDSGMANVGECLYIAIADHTRRPRQLVRRVVGLRRRAGAAGRPCPRRRPHRQRDQPEPQSGGVLPPVVLLASRRPRRPRAHHGVRRQREGVPGGVAAPRAGRHRRRGRHPRLPLRPSGRRAVPDDRPHRWLRRHGGGALLVGVPSRRSRLGDRRARRAGHRGGAVQAPPTDAARLGERRPRDGRSRARPAARRPEPTRARRPLVRWTAGAARRVGRAAAGGDGGRPGPVRHVGRVRPSARRPLEVGRRPVGRRAVRRAAGQPGHEGLLRTTHGSPTG